MINNNNNNQQKERTANQAFSCFVSLNQTTKCKTQVKQTIEQTFLFDLLLNISIDCIFYIHIFLLFFKKVNSKAKSLKIKKYERDCETSAGSRNCSRLTI